MNICKKAIATFLFVAASTSSAVVAAPSLNPKTTSNSEVPEAPAQSTSPGSSTGQASSARSLKDTTSRAGQEGASHDQGHVAIDASSVGKSEVSKEKQVEKKEKRVSRERHAHMDDETDDEIKRRVKRDPIGAAWHYYRKYR